MEDWQCLPSAPVFLFCKGDNMNTNFSSMWPEEPKGKSLSMAKIEWVGSLSSGKVMVTKSSMVLSSFACYTVSIIPMLYVDLKEILYLSFSFASSFLLC